MKKVLVGSLFLSGIMALGYAQDKDVAKRAPVKEEQKNDKPHKYPRDYIFKQYTIFAHDRQALLRWYSERKEEIDEQICTYGREPKHKNYKVRIKSLQEGIEAFEALHEELAITLQGMHVRWEARIVDVKKEAPKGVIITWEDEVEKKDLDDFMTILRHYNKKPNGPCYFYSHNFIRTEDEKLLALKPGTDVYVRANVLILVGGTIGRPKRVEDLSVRAFAMVMENPGIELPNRFDPPRKIRKPLRSK